LEGNFLGISALAVFFTLFNDLLFALLFDFSVVFLTIGLTDALLEAALAGDFLTGAIGFAMTDFEGADLTAGTFDLAESTFNWTAGAGTTTADVVFTVSAFKVESEIVPNCNMGIAPSVNWIGCIPFFSATT
jgi:hypothetical protein